MPSTSCIRFLELGFGDTEDTNSAIPMFGFNEVAVTTCDVGRIETSQYEFGHGVVKFNEFHVGMFKISEENAAFTGTIKVFHLERDVFVGFTAVFEFFCSENHAKKTAEKIGCFLF